MKLFTSRRTNLKIKLEDTLDRDREADVLCFGLKTGQLFQEVVRVLTRSGLSHKTAVNKAHQHLIYNTNIKQFNKTHAVS